jgi:hypothetical protein
LSVSEKTCGDEVSRGGKVWAEDGKGDYLDADRVSRTVHWR